MVGVRGVSLLLHMGQPNEEVPSKETRVSRVDSKEGRGAVEVVAVEITSTQRT